MNFIILLIPAIGALMANVHAAMQLQMLEDWKFLFSADFQLNIHREFSDESEVPGKWNAGDAKFVSNILQHTLRQRKKTGSIQVAERLGIASEQQSDERDCTSIDEAESAEIMRDELSRPHSQLNRSRCTSPLIGQFTSLKSTAWVACRGRRLCCHHRPRQSIIRPPPEPETQKDSEPTDLFASVVVGPPPRTLPPPRPSLPPPPPATTSSSTKSKTAGSKKAEPHATYTTPRNLYLAFYALDVGGSTAEFSERWKALEQEKPPLGSFPEKGIRPAAVARGHS
ncbi:hypothetical protein B0H14DRAFT_2585032 [Mycena olivaceomarginata]|nr:hypothetical protein B0H14DRAFT_2585032 [Mycena olivaceomarginata]